MLPASSPRVRCLLACGVAALLTLGCGRPGGEAPEKAAQGIRARTIDTHGAFLSSDAMSGRHFASPAGDSAASYIARVLGGAGIEPCVVAADLIGPEPRSFTHVFSVVLHRLGHAHSVEVFDGPRLVGGIYGVAIGRMFFGESMFSGESGGSKVALSALAARLRDWGWPLLDAQVENPHLLSLGATRMPRAAFLDAIAPLVAASVPPGRWTEAFGDIPASSLA